MIFHFVSEYETLFTLLDATLSMSYKMNDRDIFIYFGTNLSGLSFVCTHNYKGKFYH